MPPLARPGLDPGVTLPVDGVTDLGVALGVEITRDVPRGNSHAAQQHQRQMGEVLTDALAFTQRVHSRGVHTGGARHVLEFVAHPAHRLDDGLRRFVILRDPTTHPLDSLARRHVVGGSEDLVVLVDDRFGVQVLPGDVDLGVFRLLGLHHRRGDDLEFGVRGMKIERRHRRAPVVHVPVRPGCRRGFDPVEDDVLAVVRPRRQPRLVERGGDRRLVGVARRMHHTHPPHL